MAWLAPLSSDASTRTSARSDEVVAVLEEAKERVKPAGRAVVLSAILQQADTLGYARCLARSDAAHQR